ncbi:MAG TPA: hypothetical protein VHL34_11635 [Rhizomicrobium sp.]|nr:hypothetical protein [Rhizomicrobium sp.]
MTEQISYSVPAEGPALEKLKTEWLAAQIVFVAGFVLAIAFYGWWGYSHRPMAALVADAGSVDAGDVQAQMDQVVGSGETSKEGFMLCRLAIGTAQNFGVVPNTLKYAGGPATTSTAGRYVCAAEDKGGVRYLLTLDLMCKNMEDMRCANLATVTKADGTVVYHRQGSEEAPTPAAPAEDATQQAPATDGSAAPADGSGATDQSAAPPADTSGGSLDASGGAQPPPQ